MAEDRDHGDEDDGDSPPWRTIRMRYGRMIRCMPRSWVEEKVLALPGHDPGDEDPWRPLNEPSRAKLIDSLVGDIVKNLGS